MASKRGAGSELTDRNWDQEEEPEEAGNFKQADDTALKQRVIKTAKRRGTSLGTGGSSAFSGFGGFGAAGAGASKPNVSFSFGSLAPATTTAAASEKKDDKPAVNFSFGPASTTTAAASEKKDVKPAVNFSFGGLKAAEKPAEDITASSTGEEGKKTSSSGEAAAAGSSNGDTASSPDSVPSSSTDAAAATASTVAADNKSTSANDKAKAERKYLAHVKTLNKSVLAWIQKHVEDRPTCILTPVFEDYEKHLKRIEERFGVVPSDNEDSEPESAGGNMTSTAGDEAKAETSTSGTATSNGIYGDHSGDKDDTFSATKTRFTCTTPSQSAARGLDSSLKEIDSKDRAKKEDGSDGKDEPKLSHFASFSAIKTNHTFSFSNLSHTRAPTSSCNSSMKPTFSFCVSSSGEKPSETFTTSTTAAAAAASAPPTSAPSNAGLFSFGSGGAAAGFGGSTASSVASSSAASSSSSSSASSSAAESNKGIFSFGSSTTSSAPTFSFGSGGSGGSAFGGSSSLFGGSGGSSSGTTGFTGFTGFGSSVAAAASKPNGTDSKAEEGGGGDNEEYVPPKPEVQEISEDDAVFTKRCKLFYKKDDAFVDRGVGNLFIKPLSSSSEDDPKKFSLLVRADTNLGNILLNISLASLKFNAMGAKDVSFLCVPNPLPDPKMAADTPVIMLLRVKDSTIRDEVLEQLNSHA